MEPLDQLLKIPNFGKQIFNGAHYSVKFRVPADQKEAVQNLARRHPQMLVHYAKTGFVIFGGTFSRTSEFMNDCKRLTKINTPQHEKKIRHH